jgi:hypothetical protein
MSTLDGNEIAIHDTRKQWYAHTEWKYTYDNQTSGTY